MPSTNVFNELCVKITLLRPIPKKNLTRVMQYGVLPDMYRSDAY